MADILDTDEQKQKVNERDQKLKDRQAADLAKVISLPEGRRLMWRIRRECGMARPHFSQNALVMANLAGRREVGQFIEDEIRKVNLETYWQMEREAGNDQLLRTLERKELEGDNDATS